MSPHRRPHFASPELMNWSMMTCAPFAKSPNCAFPDRQTVRFGRREAVLETHHGLFRQQRIDDGEARLARRKIFERNVGLAAILVVPHRMTMEERAATAVLAA